MGQKSTLLEPSSEGAGQIGSCPVCQLALPLRLPKPGEVDADWICNGCGARYCAALDQSAPANVLKNVRPAVIHFDRECLRQPSVAIEQFVSEMVRGSDRRKSRRRAMAVPVAVVPVNDSYHPAGAPFLAMARDVSTQGMALIHTQAVEANFLVVELGGSARRTVQVVMKVLRCRALGDFYEVGGKFVDRLDAAAGR